MELNCEALDAHSHERAVGQPASLLQFGISAKLPKALFECYHLTQSRT